MPSPLLQAVAQLVQLAHPVYHGPGVVSGITGSDSPPPATPLSYCSGTEQPTPPWPPYALLSLSRGGMGPRPLRLLLERLRRFSRLSGYRNYPPLLTAIIVPTRVMRADIIVPPHPSIACCAGVRSLRGC